MNKIHQGVPDVSSGEEMSWTKTSDLGNKVTSEVKGHGHQKAHLIPIRVVGAKFEQNPSRRSGDTLRKGNVTPHEV